MNNRRDKIKTDISLSDDIEVPSINTTLEKKEVVKKAINKWKRENKEARRYFRAREVGKRHIRNDAGKRRERERSSPDTDKKVPKKLGKPKGSRGDTWKRPAESEVDKVIRIYLKKCPKCGKNSLGKPFDCWEHYVSDLVPLKRNMQLKITKYIMHRYRCKNCKNVVAPTLGVLKNCHFGFGFIAMVMQSRISRKQSYSKIMEEFNQWVPGWNQFISKTTVVNWFKKYGSNLEEFYLECVNKLKKAKYVHADETGLPMKGKNWWLWVITTTFFTLFIPHASRGRAAIEKFFKDFEGVLITDFWGAYNDLTEEQQKCLGHLVKDLKVIIMKNEEFINKIEKRLKEDDEQKEAKMKVDDGEKKRGRPKKAVEPLSREERKALEEKKMRSLQKIRHASKLYEFFIQAWSDENNPLSYKARPEIRATEADAVRQLRQIVDQIENDAGDPDPDIKRLIKRLKRYEPYLFTYLKHPGIPPDNNAAERELRPFVIMRKTSYDFKSEEVMDSFTLYLSFYQTCKKNGVDFYKALKQILSGEITPVLKALGFYGSF